MKPKEKWLRRRNTACAFLAGFLLIPSLLSGVFLLQWKEQETAGLPWWFGPALLFGFFALPILAAGGPALASHLRMKKQSPDTVSGKPSNYSRHT